MSKKMKTKATIAALETKNNNVKDEWQANFWKVRVIAAAAADQDCAAPWREQPNDNAGYTLQKVEAGRPEWKDIADRSPIC
jgi:hypothetical protein